MLLLVGAGAERGAGSWRRCRCQRRSTAGSRDHSPHRTARGGRRREEQRPSSGQGAQCAARADGGAAAAGGQGTAGARGADQGMGLLGSGPRMLAMLAVVQGPRMLAIIAVVQGSGCWPCYQPALLNTWSCAGSTCTYQCIYVCLHWQTNSSILVSRHMVIAHVSDVCVAPTCWLVSDVTTCTKNNTPTLAIVPSLQTHSNIVNAPRIQYFHCPAHSRRCRRCSSKYSS